MEIQLQELIEQIKKDGVEAAESKASEIIAAANAEAEKIIAEANAEAENIINNAKEENSRLVRASEDAIRQAGRNLLISFRESVTKELDAIAGEQVAGVYSSDEISRLICTVVEEWSKKPEADDISVILTSNDAKALEESLLIELKKKLLSGVTLKANDNFDGGFRITTSDGRAYYDYSAEAVTDMLSAYLNPRITSLMKEAESE